MQRISVDESWFEGAVSFEKGNGWTKPWRLVHEKLPLYWPEGFVQRAEHSTGVRLRFRTGASQVGVRVRPFAEPRRFDLVIEGELPATVKVEPEGCEAEFPSLPAGAKTVDLWLPADHPTVVEALLADADARPAVADDGRPKWVTYGSSITQCRSAHSPARTWPATAARMRGLNLTSLGYGGQCHLDQAVARIIRDASADVISLKLGINMHGGSVGQRAFLPAVIGFILTVRDGHPVTPLAIVSPIFSPPRERTPGGGGLTLEMMRGHLEDAVERLKACGDGNIRYFDGRELFGEDLVDPHMPDQLHPDGDGYEIIGRRFAEKVLPAMGF